MFRGERAAEYVDRHPRLSAMFIVVLLLAGLGFDGWRLAAAGERLRGAAWSQGVLAGVAMGAVLLTAVGTVRLVARRHEWGSPAAGIVGAFVTVLLFAMTHPRQHEPLRDAGEVGLLIAVDLLFAGLLVYAAVRRWRSAA